MNGILLVDKPAGWTSHDVVAKLRGVTHERRAGHSGTLDPMATGLLVVFFGRATRAVEFAEADIKEYSAGILFGTSTDTQDTSGNVIRQCTPQFTEEELEKAIEKFTGPILQLPPMYSAVKVNGKKLYEIARKGGEVERKARKINIFSLKCTSHDAARAQLEVRCSKGTYIRTLCSDIGDALGCGACMSSLRRTRSGVFDITHAHTLDDIIAVAGQGRIEEFLLPVDVIFASYSAYTLSSAQEKCVRNGASFTTNLPNGRYRVYSKDGTFIALSEAADCQLHTVKSFFEV